MFDVPTLFTRHAETTVDADHTRRAEKHTAVIDLTPRGHAQIDELAAWYVSYIKSQGWRKIIFLVSPFNRTQQTGRPVEAALLTAGIRVKWVTEPLLREINSGFYAGRKPFSVPIEEAQREQANRDQTFHYIIPPGGESLAQAHDRALLFRLKWQYIGQHTDAVGIFGHGNMGRVQLTEACERPWQWYWAEPNLPNAATRRLENGEDHGFIFQPSCPTAEPELTAAEAQA